MPTHVPLVEEGGGTWAGDQPKWCTTLLGVQGCSTLGLQRASDWTLRKHPAIGEDTAAATA